MKQVSAIVAVLLLVAGTASPAAAVGQQDDSLPEGSITAVAVETGPDNDGDGYSVLSALDISADTSLDDTDSYGSNPGEPYFEVEINGEDVVQTGVVSRSEDYTTRLEIPSSALDGLERGTHSITVYLGDADDDVDAGDEGNDDRIATWEGSFNYEPSSELSLKLTRRETVVGSPVTVGVDGGFDGQFDWRLVDKPSGSSASVGDTYGSVATVKPDRTGKYTVQARSNGQTATVSFSATSNTDYRVLERYAPIIELAKNERYRPTRYEAFVQHASLQNLGDENTDNPTPFELVGRGTEWELDLRGDQADYTSYQREYPPTVYGSVHRDVSFRGKQYDKAVTYWLFYVYDPKAQGEIESLVAHQSDLESVTVLVDDGTPRWVGASQHYGGELREWEKAPSQGSHVEVYPAKGAHSNYLRDTTQFSGNGLLGQSQHVPTGDSATVISDSLYTDQTGGGERLTHSGTGTNYELVTLTGTEWLAKYEGAFGPKDGKGQPPMFRDRWKQPGQWLDTGILPDEAQVKIDVSGTLSAADGEVSADLTVENIGPKPTTVWAGLYVKPESASWESEKVRRIALDSVSVGTETTKSLTVSGPTVETSAGAWDAQVLVLSYPPKTAETEDIEHRATEAGLYSVEATQSTTTETTRTETTRRTTSTPTSTATATTETPESTSTPSPQTESGGADSGEGATLGFTGTTVVVALVGALLVARQRRYEP